MWTAWVLASAVVLAFYDLAKKASVRENSVLPVLLCSTFFGGVAFVGVLAASGNAGVAFGVTGREFCLIAIKSLIVSTSWVLTFKALQTLPITVATPIRASAPALVFVMALFVYGERPTWLQAAGMTLVFLGYWAFSWAGKHEGIDFLRNRAVWFACGGMAMSAISSIWDKFILQKCAITVERVQFWFQVDLVAVYAILLAVGLLLSKRRRNFEWRWTIPMVGILLAGADWLYFHALAMPDVPISVASLMRRFSVAITFLLGAVCFRERNLLRKGIALAAIVAGIALLCAKNV